MMPSDKKQQIQCNCPPLASSAVQATLHVGVGIAWGREGSGSLGVGSGLQILSIHITAIRIAADLCVEAVGTTYPKLLRLVGTRFRLHQ